MKNAKGNGERIHLIAPNGGVVTGDPFLKGAIVGVVGNTAAQGELHSVLTIGEYEQTIEKAANTAYDAGTPVFFKTAKTLTVVAANRLAGSPVYGYLTTPIASAAGASVAARVSHGRNPIYAVA